MFDSAEQVSSEGLVPNEVDMASLPDTLDIHQQGKNPSHHEIYPKEPMSEAAFNEELGKIKVKGGCGA